MDDERQIDDEGRGPHRGDEARVRARKWSPLVWVVPIAAILFVGFLVVRYGVLGSKDITVRFADARGLERYAAVRFRGVKVGTVQKITIDKNLGQVLVRLSIDPSMKDALRKNTRFWVVQAGLAGGGIGGLLSGTYVGMAPGDGEGAREFTGQEYSPVVSPGEAGRTYILAARGLGSVAIGSPVEFQGFRAGSILGAEYDEKQGVTLIHAFVVSRFADHVRQGTRFWRGGGIDVSLSGGGVSVGGASLGSLLDAPISFYTPEVLAGPVAADRTRFDLYDSQTLAEAAADGPQLTYATTFRGSVKGLKEGTPVQMNGLDVGRVRSVNHRYLADSASLETPVILEIDPRKLQLPVSESTTREELRATMNDALGKLVQKGMRASLASSLVLPGTSAVNLDLTGAVGTARLGVASDPPVIPAATAGSGIDGAIASLNDLGGRIKSLPLEEISDHLESAAKKVDTLVSDPKLHDSVEKLNASLADIQKVATAAREGMGPILKNANEASASAASAAKKVDENVDPIIKSLRDAASSAEAAAKSAEALIGSAPKQNYDLGQLIKQLTQAAEAVRALASYLSENPDALLKGRGK